jgi:hypothetical protein
MSRSALTHCEGATGERLVIRAGRPADAKLARETQTMRAMFGGGVLAERAATSTGLMTFARVRSPSPASGPLTGPVAPAENASAESLPRS